MSGETHTLIGLAAGTAVGLLWGSDPVVIAIGAISAAMIGKLPDVIEKPLGLDHRKTSHSLFAVLAFGWLCVSAAGWVGVPAVVGWSLAAGYLSHIVSDCLTISGVYILAPANRKHKLHLLPRGFRVRTASSIDYLLGAAAGLFVLFILLTNVSEILAGYLRFFQRASA